MVFPWFSHSFPVFPLIVINQLVADSQHFFGAVDITPEAPQRHVRKGLSGQSDQPLFPSAAEEFQGARVGLERFIVVSYALFIS